MSSESPAPVPMRRPAVGAGLICFKDDSVLLIKICKEQHVGRWSIPGGHVEWGETTREAALRETFEETNIRAEIFGMIDVIDLFLPERHLVLIDYAGRWVSGEPIAGDDALHAEFVPLAAIEQLGMWPETLRVIYAGARMIGLAEAPPIG